MTAQCLSKYEDGLAFWDDPAGSSLAGNSTIPSSHTTDPFEKPRIVASVINFNRKPTDIQRPGTCVPAFKEWYYNQILIVPNLVSLGRILSNLNNTFEVWNAYINETQTLNTITGPTKEETGLEITPINVSNPPVDYPPLRSHNYNLLIDLEGPPSANAVYTYSFENEFPTFTVTGFRLLVFPFVPQKDFIERFQWQTSVIESFNSKEKFAKIRSLPRRELDYSYRELNTVKRGRLFNLLNSGLAFNFAVPIWQQRRQVQQPVTIGATVIYIDTAETEFESGKGFFLYQNDRLNETGVIDQVFSDRITTLSPVEGAFDNQAICTPILVCILPKQFNSSLFIQNVTDTNVKFRALDSSVISSADLNDQYKGLDVLHDRPEVSGNTVTWVHEGKWEEINYQTGIFSIDPSVTWAKTIRTYQKTFINDVSGVWAFKQWLYKLSGRQGVFWIPSYDDSLILVSTIGISETAIEIENVDLAPVFRNTSWVTDIELELLDGTIFRREITDVQRTSDTIETITVDAIFNTSIAPTDLKHMSLLLKARLLSDTVEFKWSGLNICVVSFGTSEVLE